MKKNLNTPNTAAIILAAGAGTRAQQKNEKKQFCCIQGKTILEITLEIFISHPAIKHIALVIDPSDRNKCEKILQNNPRLSEKQLHIVNGGKTRQESAFLGLKALKEQNIDYVHIHDAARPFLQQEQITALQKAVQPQLGAILAIPISDTVKKADQQDFVIDTIERKNLYRAQTPQTFPYQKILAAHMKAAQDQIECTDDAMVAKYYGLQTKIIISTENNIKITWPEDLIKANQMKKHQIHSSQLIFPNVRVGHGYDVHSFVPGTHIFLCGIKIPFHKALNGHSDSDAPLHALTDALLSTIGYGAIGIHFPPSEEEWKLIDGAVRTGMGWDG